MSYAEPAQPKKTLVATRQVIDEAAALAAMKTHREKVDLRIDIEDAVTDLFIDSGQIVSALANIFANAVESYDDESGPVTISVQRGGSTVKMEISDNGRGMDKETLAKAIYPFYSSKPAGRKRGMGLAYASRFIELNGGTLKIDSEPGKGTTVTVTLPTS
jgi:signal transduction histidine kinase